MTTIRFEKRLALNEVTETFLALNEAFTPSILGIEIYGGKMIELRAQVSTREDKKQFIQTAKTMVTKGVEFESYYNRTIRKHCITLTWRIES